MATTFPLFRVEASFIGEASGVVGTITRTTHGRDTWVGDDWIGYLKTDARLIAGRWHRRGDLWEFVPKNLDDVGSIVSRAEWEVLDGYWGDRAEIVLDETLQWEKARFKPTNAIRVQDSTGVWLKKPLTDTANREERAARLFPAGNAGAGNSAAGTEVIEAAWNHEHCAICWESIGRGGLAEGFVSTQQTWVCERCYMDFVQQRSLAFIPNI